MFRRWERDPLSVDTSWRNAFERMENKLPTKKATHAPFIYPPSKTLEEAGVQQELRKYQIEELIREYRINGHLDADFNPFERKNISGRSGYSDQELGAFFPTLGILPQKEAPLSLILDRLDALYQGSLGFEFEGVVPDEEAEWLAKEVEGGFFLEELPLTDRQKIFEGLSKADLFETFMHTKFVGQKRFSIEGAESLIPMLGAVVESGVESFVIGMAHRGRLNVLSNILDKSYQEIFSEFHEGYLPDGFKGTGDVKYHKGYEKGDIFLPPNPSHLESIDSVVEGIVKGKQVKESEEKVMAILIHGDAALAGQGVVYETLQMQSLPGYGTGGTIHFVINNQIGFTTSPEAGRSTRYCTDIAKAFKNPVIHVNGADPEACFKAAKLASKYRAKFHRDIFIDLYCWRKYGHNEGDEPSFTQPELYRHIKEMIPVRESYREKLIGSGLIESAIVEEMEKSFKRALAEAKDSVQFNEETLVDRPKTYGRYMAPEVKTAIPDAVIQDIGRKLSHVPERFNIHPKVLALAEEREAMALGKKPINWGMAEMLAYGSLVLEGHGVRISGQDVERGTFSHRHAVYVDQETGGKYMPLAHLQQGQAPFSIYNSILSEYGVLAFEYGYSLVTPEGLTIWEAQFGDFANGGQIIFDQYMAPAEAKWGQTSNLTVFLPHGYEGQGPEHSSGRLERMLTLAGERNLRISIPTLPAQHFHLLRRQTLDPEKKPLIIFTPKALLRLPAASSRVKDFTEGRFEEILDDPSPPPNPSQLIFCSGKIYFELKAEQEKVKDSSSAIVRIEQLYPLDKKAILELFKRYEKVKRILWVQEEPKNMGAAYHIAAKLTTLLKREIEIVARPVSATTASGIYAFHKKEARDIMERVFKDKPTTYDIAGQFRA